MNLGCLITFLVPFFMVAVGTGVVALWKLSTGDLALAGFFSVFTITFGGMAAFVLRSGLKARQFKAARERQQRDHPDEPWMWRDDWASGRIESQNRTKMRFVWFFAIMWNVIAVPGGVLGLKAYLDDGEKAALLALLFPFIGVFLLIWAVREAIRHHKFGISVLELDPVPGVIGSGIKGTVRTAIHFHPDDGVFATLTCVRRVTTGSGKNRSTREHVLWQDEQEVGHPRRELHRMAMPIAFRIPVDVQASDDSNPSDQVIWRLGVRAEVPGVDYQATFDVPVFDAGERVDLPDDAWSSLDAERAAYEGPSDSKIEVITTSRGTEIYYPAARNPGVALGATVFLVIWLGATAWITTAGAPIIFPLVFSLFGVLLLYVVLLMWFGTMRVVAGRTVLAVTQGFLFVKRTKRLDPAAAEDVTVDMGMQSGRQVFYRIHILGADGTKVNAGRGIDDKREAEWLASHIKSAIKLSTAAGASERL